MELKRAVRENSSQASREESFTFQEESQSHEDEYETAEKVLNVKEKVNTALLLPRLKNKRETIFLVQ